MSRMPRLRTGFLFAFDDFSSVDDSAEEPCPSLDGGIEELEESADRGRADAGGTTNEELIEDMYRAYRRYRGRPIYHQHKRRGGKISPGTIREWFGSWEVAKAELNAFLRCRGVYNDQMPLPVEDRELFDEVRYVWKRSTIYRRSGCA